MVRAWIVLVSLALALPPAPGRTPNGGGAGVRVILDSRHVQLALEFLDTGREDALARLASTPASAHLLRHARAFEYDVPRDSEAALARGLLTPREQKRGRMSAAERVLAFFDGPLRNDPVWVAEVRRALPPDENARVSLFLTFGYDIGVSMPGTASLNAAHRHFEEHPSELRYYAVHECHHAVFMRHQRPRPIAEWKTAADLLAQAEYALQLEGMAVWAAWDLREREGALDGDDDYVALRDEAQMARLETRYLEAHRALAARAGELGPANEASRALLLGLYGPDRIFYRVGALAARRIERARGRAAVVELVKAGPRAFFDAYVASTTPTL